MSQYEDVRAFHRFFGHPMNARPTWISEERFNRRVEWKEEEIRELKEAWEKKDIVAVADALADLQYFVIGTAVEMGIPLSLVWDEVHKANMRKAHKRAHDPDCDLIKSWPHKPSRCSCGAVLYHDSGKTKKPDGWIGPEQDIATFLRNPE